MTNNHKRRMRRFRMGCGEPLFGGVIARRSAQRVPAVASAGGRMTEERRNGTRLPKD